MVGRYLEAVEAQYAAVRLALKVGGNHWANKRFKELISAYAVAEPYFWDSACIRRCESIGAALDANRSYPVGLESPEWWYFGNSQTGALFYRMGTFIAMSCRGVFHACDPALPLREWWAVNGSTVNTAEESASAERLLRLFIAGTAYRAERLSVLGRSDRGLSHRLARDARVSTADVSRTVKIITLRAKDYEAVYGVAIQRRSPHYDHRWTVRMHDRRLTDGRVVNVQSYVKGPKDAPLLVPTHTIYAVSR